MYVDAADFDGSNDYMRRGTALSGIADSKKGILSCWLRIDGGDNTTRQIIGGVPLIGTRFEFFNLGVSGSPFNSYLILCRNATPADVLRIRTNSSWMSGGGWHHVLASWDLSVPTSHLYLNDVSDQIVTTRVNDTIDWDGQTDWSVGDDGNAANKWNGAKAELYFAPGQYLDFSVEANRRKFITADGRPQNLGSDGSAPTGIAPLVYLHLADGEAVSNFATNRGTGGNFSITGTLDTASTSPSGDPLLATTGHIVIAGKTPSITFTRSAGTGHVVTAGHAPSLTRGLIAATGHLVLTGHAPSMLFFPPLELDMEAELSPTLDFEAALAPELELDLEAALALDLDMTAELAPDLDFEVNV